MPEGRAGPQRPLLLWVKLEGLRFLLLPQLFPQLLRLLAPQLQEPPLVTLEFRGHCLVHGLPGGL